MDSQRTTVTRLNSSLTLTKKPLFEDKRSYYDMPPRVGRYSSLALGSESGVSIINRPKGSVQKEIVTYMFASMLNNIVESWEIIGQGKTEENYLNKEFGKISESFIFPSKKKKPVEKSSKLKRSKSELFNGTQDELMSAHWWSSPDERAIIRFRNGNTYEGNISMKCMNGEGCFRWADGTEYLGHFKDNEINGRGLIKWKDDTWYEGDFVGNLRQGNGLYVDSRMQRSYIGQWYNGTKHGQGVIYYSDSFKNSYDGQWLHNVRHGFGSREYCPLSGYEGEWDLYVREGKGLMIWPNHDFYRGEWKNGVMSGYGTYIWDAYYNDSLSQPSMILYRGQWMKGQRHGCGMLNLGIGAHYTGEFICNQKNGKGMLVSNNGFILRSKQLFQDDNLDASVPEDNDNLKREHVQEPYKFDISSNSVDLYYHIQQAIKNIEKQQGNRLLVVNKFIENNKTYTKSFVPDDKEISIDHISNDLISFEISSLRKSLQYYESDLKRIYYKYCTICNTNIITFTPVLIRLYLWQIYYDCGIHEKGVTLVEIDNIFCQNPKWLAHSPHDPFEPIFFWQFLHSFLSVASKLYAKKELPGAKPDTILANAFRTFMEKDILPGVRQQKGLLVNGYGEFIPLKSLYNLYLSLGEPHTLLTFLRAVRLSPHDEEYPQPPLEETSETTDFPLGRNVNIFGDEIMYVLNSYDINAKRKSSVEKYKKLKLFSFANLSSKSIITIFSSIFPQVIGGNNILDLDIEITFLEFFEIFVACAIKSVCEDENSQLREEFSLQDFGMKAPPQSPNFY
ncbi:unnamed protein product [Parnassius mnemosyne]|uniref:Radial spoke head 10 homolog B n=1 Tax=Parnassius mnemosyne TaxID=213953 RepID=A0AAV1M5V5_9NEOP